MNIFILCFHFCFIMSNIFATSVFLHDTEVHKGMSLPKPLAVESALCSSNGITTSLLP